MRSAQIILNCLKRLGSAFYRSILKLSINAHQLYSHWRIRINKPNLGTKNEDPTHTTASATKLIPLTSPGTGQSQENSLNFSSASPATTSSSPPIEIAKRQQEEKQQQQPQSAPNLFQSISTTPNSRKVKFYSLLRRLSLRNFMEYCVIALNEASSSSCSNKFDLSSCETPVWLLGQLYDLPQDVSKLIDDIRSKLWITYRRNFPPIDENSRYTTDRGFGCMIRCGQMVLANALLYKNLGRNWRWMPDGGLELNPDVYVKILRLFQDKENSLYSIHNIVKTGQQEGITVGEWFGPNTIAQALKRISTAQTAHDEVLISIDAALDNVVVIDEVKAKFRRRRQDFKSSNADNLEHNSTRTATVASIRNGFEQNDLVKREEEDVEKRLADGGNVEDESAQFDWVPGILFIQLRLGLTKINPLYFAALRKTFQFKNSLGIIGGRPNHALYLIGYTDNDIIYLDPHSTQQYIDLDSNLNNQQSTIDDNQIKSSPIDSTYHCACPEKMPIDRLDPSLALCFYFHTEKDLDDWCSLSNDLLIKFEQAPMFEITKLRPFGAGNAKSTNNRSGETGGDLKTTNSSPDANDEEFEMLG